MKIRDFLETREYALVEAEIIIKDEKAIMVNIVGMQTYYDFGPKLEELFEHDILPDCKINELEDGGYFVSVLMDISDNEDFKIEEYRFEPYSIIEPPFEEIEETDTLPF